MSILIAAACGAAIWAAIAFPVAVVICRAIHLADPGETGPDGTAGDLLADQPAEIRGIDAEFRRLTDPLEQERKQRMRGRVIWP